MRLCQHFRFGFTEPHSLAIGTLHLPRQEKPRGNEQDQRQPIHQKRHKPRHTVTQRLCRKVDALLAQAGNQRGIIGRIGLEGPTIGQCAMNIGTRDHDACNTPRIDLAQKLAIAHILRRSALARVLEQSDQRQHQQKYNGP